MTQKELIAEMVGTDEMNMPKCFIGIFNEKWNENGTVRRISENTIYKPTVELFAHPKYLQIDFKFKSPADQDLIFMWGILQNYCKSDNSSDEETGEYPVLMVNIAPKKYNGRYYLLAYNPIIHTLQPDTANSEPTVIRMVFADDDFEFVQNSEATAEDGSAELVSQEE